MLITGTCLALANYKLSFMAYLDHKYTSAEDSKKGDPAQLIRFTTNCWCDKKNAEY